MTRKLAFNANNDFLSHCSALKTIDQRECFVLHVPLFGTKLEILKKFNQRRLTVK